MCQSVLAWIGRAVNIIDVDRKKRAPLSVERADNRNQYTAIALSESLDYRIDRKMKKRRSHRSLYDGNSLCSAEINRLRN